MYMQEVSGVFASVLNLHYADILKSKVGYQKTFLDLQIKPIQLIENDLKPFIIAYYRKNIRI
jgi:hypothetical protein